MAGDYTPAERMVLIAGMSGGRDSVWSQNPGAVQSLGERGLIEMSLLKRADGMVESIPRGLSFNGIIEARKLQDS